MPALNVDGEAFAALASEILGQGHGLRFRARGVSMRPFIQDGDVLEVTPPERMRLRVGDVVLFEDHDGSVLAHRVVRIRDRGVRPAVQMKGDAFFTPDGWIPIDRIVGIVTAVERDGEPTRLDTGGQRLRGRLWQCRYWLLRQCSRTLRLVRSIRQVSAERSRP